MQILFSLTGIGYILGGLVFGIALFRARVLDRWAALLLAVSTVATAALAVLPESFNRPMAVPEGVALIALGISLWRDQRNSGGASVTQTSAGEQMVVRWLAEKRLFEPASLTSACSRRRPVC